jgi:hypothetical protein
MLLSVILTPVSTPWGLEELMSLPNFLFFTELYGREGLAKFRLLELSGLSSVC